MKIWIFNNYNMLPEHGALNRHYYFGKYLKLAGHEPTAFVGSHPHNTNIQLISGKQKFIEYQDCEFPWVLIKTCNYEGSKAKRVFSMIQYYLNLMEAVKHYRKPDVIIGSSAHPLAALAAIKLGKKYHCKAIVEIRDLWPESIVAYGICKKYNPIIQALYKLEKWIYTKADAIVFSMEGGRDYIIDKGWDTDHGGPVDLHKVHHINNGVDLKEFDYNQQNFMVSDPDLSNPDTYKVVYTGSLRQANKQILPLLDAIELLKSDGDKKTVFLIYGKGELLTKLQAICEEKNLNNVIFKDYVPKHNVPYILSQCDLCILNCKPNKVSHYGGSQNKLFEYLASGRPIISGEDGKYSVVAQRGCGICREFKSPQELADAITELRSNPIAYDTIRGVAEEYDFCRLTQNLIAIIENTTQLTTSVPV